MSKRKNKKQQRKQLPVVNPKNNPQAVIDAPSSATPAMENSTNNSSSVGVKLSIPSPSIPPASPKVEIPAKSVPTSLEPGQLRGVVLSRFYENGVPAFGKIKSGSKLYTCHSSAGPIPPEGTGVIFTVYTHEAKMGRQVSGAKIVRVDSTTDDEALKAKVLELNKQPKLKILHLQDFLQDNTLQMGDVMGRTPEGDVVYLLSDTWS